jgi:hypothetical protein
MKSEKLMSIAAIALLVALAIPVSLAAQDNWHNKNGKIITFNAPGAGTGSGQGTVPIGPNVWGSIVGFYFDTNSVTHGFLRATDGTFTTFDPTGSTATYAFGLNDEGAITGDYFDSSGMCHGFLRATDGTFTTFDPTGSTCTTSGNLNDFGVIGGYYSDSSGVSHGFLRVPDGAITTFDAPGAGTGSGQGTFDFFLDVLNELGAITGYYVDANNVSHGYVRAPNGAITTFNVKGAGTGSGQGTFTDASNQWCEITGWYIDANGVYHGFLRLP